MVEQKKIRQEKLQKVEEIKQMVMSSPLCGIIDMVNLPTLQLQRMRTQLKDVVQLKMIKKRLILIAFDQLKDALKNIEQLKSKVRGQPALLFTKENPFRLYKQLQKSKSTAPAKGGQIAPNDIAVSEGPTQFAPGPIIGELGQLGLKTEVKEGKVSIKEGKVIVKEGQQISQKVADVLTKLGIEPMEVGLNLICTYEPETGTIFTKDILSLDEKAYINNIKTLSVEAYNLAIAVAYLSKDTIKVLVQKAQRNASALAKSRDIITKETLGGILNKAEHQASHLKVIYVRE